MNNDKCKRCRWGMKYCQCDEPVILNPHLDKNGVDMRTKRDNFMEPPYDSTLAIKKTFMDMITKLLEQLEDKQGTAAAKKPEIKKSALLNAVDMLEGNGYKTIAIAVPTKEHAFDFIDEIKASGEEYRHIRTKNQLHYKGTVLSFFVHGENKDATRLRGPQYHAAVVQGQPMDEFSMTLSFCIRLGEHPLVVKI